jgi:hypothetical protein
LVAQLRESRGMPDARLLLPWVALLTVACQSTAKGTWEAMRKAGCDADVAAFEQHLDKTRVKESALKHAGIAKDSVLAGLAAGAARDAIDQWTDEVKRGPDGGVCGWTLVDAAENTVRFNTVSGEERFARFEEHGKNWLMVELGDRAD